MIVLTAVMKALEANGDDLAKVIQEFVPKFENDPGLIMYKAHRRVDNPLVFFFYEKYENNEALTFHASAPHFKEMGRAMRPFLDGKADIAMYQEI
jgi:quinol monooxygenase YgiN